MDGFLITGGDTPQLNAYKKGRSIILDMGGTPPYPRSVTFEFNKDTYNFYYESLLKLAKEIWPDLELKDVTGAGNDYGEYYDRELDNDGSASIGETSVSFCLLAYHLGSNRLYRFTKSKMQTYLFELRKHTNLTD